MRRKNHFIVISALLLSGCSQDITVASDLGEKTIVKRSGVTTSKWEATDALKELSGEPDANGNARINYKKQYENCLKYRAMIPVRIENDQAVCWREWGSRFTKFERENAALEAFVQTRKSITLINYRPISVDLNGRKTAANGYSKIACIPKPLQGDVREKALSAARAAALDLGEGNTPGSVAASVYREVCNKYGD